MQRFIEEALVRAPSVAVLRARLAAANARIEPAAALPDPTAEIMVQEIGTPTRDSWSEGRMLGAIELRQQLALPNKRRARRQAALAVSGVQAAELIALRRALATEVRRNFGRLHAIDRERELLGAARELMVLLEATAADCRPAGQERQEAVAKVQIEALRLAERDDDLAAARRTTVAVLNRLLGRSPGAFVDEVAALPEIAPPPLPWREAALAQAPVLAVRRAAVAAAESEAAAVAVERWPNLLVGGALGMQSPLSPLVQLRFGVELPAWIGDKQEPLERAARLEVRQARAELRDAETAVLTELTRLAARWERDTAQIARHRDDMLPQTAAALDAARASYLAGHGDFSTVVEDFELWLEARAQLARCEADRYVTWAEIDELTGELEKPKLAR
ncbi:MAG: TolC family protein [Deltaproteobacteria bacterium]|nr:TolC family protein [Deltaproteobacteria bacterium]